MPSNVDPAARANGVEVIEVRDGHAVAAMTITGEMVNSHGICHGGMIFLLADVALDNACNTAEGLSVAAHAEIDYVRSAHVGDELLATATVQDRWGRTQLIDAAVSDKRTGETIAHFRGRTRRVRTTT